MCWDGGKTARSWNILKYCIFYIYICLLLVALKINWILCLVCPGMPPKSRAARIWQKTKIKKKKRNHRSVDKHFTVLLGRAFLQLVEFLRWWNTKDSSSFFNDLLMWSLKGRLRSVNTARALDLLQKLTARCFSEQHKQVPQWCQEQNKSLFLCFYSCQIFLNICIL